VLRCTEVSRQTVELGHSLPIHLASVPANVRWDLISTKSQTCRERREGPLSAARTRSKTILYSITSSARASRVGGTVMPSSLAVFRFTESVDLVGSSTGMIVACPKN
jgi:hypothetical protein